MEGFTLVDGAVALVIVLSAVLAYSRGLVRESLAILGWVGAAALAYAFAAQAKPLIRGVPFLDKLIGENCELSIIVSFASLFAISLVIASLFTPLLSSAVQRSILGGLDQGLGFLFGVFRGMLLVAVAFVVYDKVLGGSRFALVDDSRSMNLFEQFSKSIETQIPTDAPVWILARYSTLIESCPQAEKNSQTPLTESETQAVPDATASP